MEQPSTHLLESTGESVSSGMLDPSRLLPPVIVGSATARA